MAFAVDKLYRVIIENGKIVFQKFNDITEIWEESIIKTQGLNEDVDKIVFGKTIQVPPGSIEVGQNVRLSSANNGLSVLNKSRDIIGLLTGQIYSPDIGTQRPFDYNAAAETTAIIQNIDTQISSSNEIKWLRTTDTSSIISAFIIKASGSSNGVIITIRESSESGGIIYQLKGINLVDGENILNLNDESGQLEPLILSVNETIHITIENATLKGTVISGNFVPYYGTKRNVYNPLPLLVDVEDIYLIGANTNDISLAATPSVIDIGTIYNYNEIVWDSVNKDITIPSDGIYQFNVTVNISTNVPTTVYSFIQKYNPDTSTWEKLSYSGAKSELTGTTEGIVLYNTARELIANTKYRLMMYKSLGTVSLDAEIIGDVEIPSIKLNLKKW